MTTMSEDNTKKTGETIDITPEITFSPDREWECRAEYIFGVAEGVDIKDIESKLTESDVVDTARLKEDAERDQLSQSVHDLRRSEYVESINVEWTVSPTDRAIHATLMGAYPIQSPGMAGVMFSMFGESLLEDIDSIRDIHIKTYETHQQRERTIEDTMSVDFGHKKYVEQDDGSTRLITNADEETEE